MKKNLRAKTIAGIMCMSILGAPALADGCKACVETYNDNVTDCYFSASDCKLIQTPVLVSTSTSSWTWWPTPPVTWNGTSTPPPGVCSNCCAEQITVPCNAPPMLCQPSPSTALSQRCVTVTFGGTFQPGAGGVSIGGFNFTGSTMQCTTVTYVNPCPPATVPACQQYRYLTKYRAITRKWIIDLTYRAVGTVTAIHPNCAAAGTSGSSSMTLECGSAGSFDMTETQLEWVSVMCGMKACVGCTTQ